MCSLAFPAQRFRCRDDLIFRNTQSRLREFQRMYLFSLKSRVTVLTTQECGTDNTAEEHPAHSDGQENLQSTHYGAENFCC